MNLVHAHFEISTLCNSQCIMCPQSKINRTKIIDVEKVKDVLKNELIVFKDTINVIEFHNYNEPLITADIFFDLAQVVNSIYGIGKVGLVSNGSIMSEDIANRLIDLQLSHLYFSIDGFSDEIYEQHRIGLKRNTIYNNINLFLDIVKERQSKMPTIVCTVTLYNIRELSMIKGYWVSKGASVLFQRCDGRGGTNKLSELENVYSDEPCTYALDGLYVLSNLDVVPCCEDWEGNLVLGNLYLNTINEIWNSNSILHFRELQLNKEKSMIPLCSICKTNMIYGSARYIDSELDKVGTIV